MTTDQPYWNIRGNFRSDTPEDIIAGLLASDDANRVQILSELPEEIGLVDKGLALYVECLRGALLVKGAWNDDVALRASLSVLAQLFNTFLAWRQLAIAGYLSEARLFTRFVHESLILALALTHSSRLAEKFMKGHQISMDDARRAFARRVGREDRTTLTELNKDYRRLSRAAHPSLETLTLRTIRSSPGRGALAKALPEGVMYGGLLSSDIARASLLGLANNIWGALRWVAIVVRDASGTWDSDVEDWHHRLQSALDAYDPES